MNDASESAKSLSQKKSFDHILEQHYTVFDGLAGMHVEDIYQDRPGLLWIAFRYVGTEPVIVRWPDLPVFHP